MPRERIRAVYPTTVMQSGRGIPPVFAHLINTPVDSEEDEEGKKNPDLELDDQWKHLSEISAQWNDPKYVSAFKKLTTEVLDLEFYDADTEPTSLSLDPDKDESGIDVGLMDKYAENIILHREIIAEECLDIRKNWEINAEQLARMKSSIPRMTRHAYYGNEYAQKMAESCVPLLVWILNKPKLPKQLVMLTVKSLSEMLYSSKRLKRKFAQCKGAKLLLHCMRDMPEDPEIACWAGYCLCVASINSPEIMEQAKRDKRLLDLLTEFAFDIYWFNWPVNFGLILKGIYFGPQPPHRSEDFQFM